VTLKRKKVYMEINRHAYLIIAHNNWHQLGTLLELLDDTRNDIFVHIDKRANSFNSEVEETLRGLVNSSELVFIPRKNVYWADYSVADVEFDLLEAARNKQEYRYYHLLSGMDLPLKTQDELHEFFDNETHEFIGMTIDGGDYVENHTRYYHLFVHNRFYRNNKPLKALDRGLMYAQKLLGLKRQFGSEITVSTGWQWFSITDEFCSYVLSERSFVEKMFSYVLDVDEKFIGTLVNKCGCHDKLYYIVPQGAHQNDYKNGCLRMVDFDVPVPRPYTWGRGDTQKDFDTLMNSGMLFARKFDENVNSEIIDMIVNKLSERKAEE